MRRPWSSMQWSLLWKGLLSLLAGACALISHAESYRWTPLEATWGRVTGAPDQSALNEPLTPAHTLTVVGSHFHAVGPDLKAGTPDDKRVRLFGINLGRDANFPPPEQARDVATTLRSLGFNAVRLHQLDAAPTDDPGVFRSVLTQGPYPSFHRESVQRLKHFIRELKSQGIYTNVNLMVGYVFRPQQDGTPPLDEGGTATGYGSPVHVFYPKMVALQTDYARSLIGQLELGNDPALAQVEIINESSLAAAWLHWDKTYWEREIRGAYADELNTQWRQWAINTHGNWETACASWGTCATDTGQVLTPAQADALQHTISADWWIRLKQRLRQWWASVLSAFGWTPDDTPAQQSVHPKVADTLRFVADTDKRFMEHMRSVVRQFTRSDLPVTGTQMDFGAPLNFISHRNMDYVDAHFYVDHPLFPGEPWSDTDWHFHNETVSGREFLQLTQLRAFRDPQRPFVVSEYNQPFPNTHGHDILPVTAAFAAQEDWDGLFFFAYGGTTENQSVPAHFFLQGEWAKASVVGLAAHLFRTEALPVRPSDYRLDSDESAWLATAATERRPDTWLRHLTRGGLLQLQPTASANTGLQHFADERRVIIQTDGLAAVLGEVATSSRLTVGALSVELVGSGPRERVGVVLQSLDGLSLTQSRHMLLALPSPVTASSPKHGPLQPYQRIPYRGQSGKWTLEPTQPDAQQPSGSRTQVKGPAWIHKPLLRIGIASTHRDIQVYPLTTDGKRLPQPAGPFARVTAGGVELDMTSPQTPSALWYEVVLK